MDGSSDEKSSSSTASNIVFRPIDTTTNGQDQEHVWTILREAAHDTEVSLHDTQANPLLQPYATNFGGRPGDVGILAMDQDTVASHDKDNDNDNENNDATTQKLVGGAWVRILPEGFAVSVLQDKDHPVRQMPELAIAVMPQYRNRGMGRRLLKALLDQVQSTHDTVPGVCLSCRLDNTSAMKLYENVGFQVVEGSHQTNRAGGTSVTMAYEFHKDETVIWMDYY